MHETPEGYLVCVAVPIARLGDMTYSAAEAPNIPTSNGRVIFTNTESVLFSEETLASYEGKSVTVQHPDPNKDPTLPDVTPENWQEVTVGTMQNVRRGEGQDADKLVCDLMISAQSGIDAVRSGMREVSCGYDSESEPTADGRAVRTKIIDNHVAIVDAGRAGSGVAIRDSKTEGKKMKLRLRDLLPKWLADGMPEEIEVSESVEDADPMKAMDSRMKKLEDAIGEMLEKMEVKKAVEEENAMSDEDKQKAADAAAAEEAAKLEAEKNADKCTDADVLANAEIIAAGLEPTADIKVVALKAAMKTTDGKAAIDKVTYGKEINFDNADIVDFVFRGTANVLKEQRQGAFTRTTDAAPLMTAASVTPEQLNAKHAEIWHKRGN